MFTILDKAQAPINSFGGATEAIADLGTKALRYFVSCNLRTNTTFSDATVSVDRVCRRSRHQGEADRCLVCCSGSDGSRPVHRVHLLDRGTFANLLRCPDRLPNVSPPLGVLLQDHYYRPQVVHSLGGPLPVVVSLHDTYKVVLGNAFIIYYRLCAFHRVRSSFLSKPEPAESLNQLRQVSEH